MLSDQTKQTYCPIPQCGKHNPNPLALIPWIPLPEWSLHTLLVMAQSRKYPYTVTGKRTLQIHIDGVCWKYLDINNNIYRKPALHIYPPPPLHEGIEGASDTRFLCEVCGKHRPQEQLKYVKCGASAHLPTPSHPAQVHMDDMMTYTICAPCISNGALTNSRKLGFKVEVLP